MILTDMYEAIQSAGMEVYLAGQAEGECIRERIVIGDAGVIPEGKSLGKHIYAVTGFVPASRSTDIAALMDRARTALTSVRALRPTGESSEGEIIDEIKAYAVTAEYYALCAL